MLKDSIEITVTLQGNRTQWVFYRCPSHVFHIDRMKREAV